MMSDPIPDQAHAVSQMFDLQRGIETRDKVIAELSHRINQSWWGRLSTHIQADFWRKRAKRHAEKLIKCRDRRKKDQKRIQDALHELVQVVIWLEDNEWQRTDPGGRPMERTCPECMTTWDGWMSPQPPEHDCACALGKVSASSRRALKILIGA